MPKTTKDHSAASSLCMTAKKPFLFRGKMLEEHEEFSPDTAEQAKLLEVIGFAAPRRRGYRRRDLPAAERVVVMEAESSVAIADGVA